MPVYENVALGGPVRPEDVAECVLFALTRPPNVNVDEIVVTRSRSLEANRPRGMSMGLTILEGSTFCICDEIGDLDGGRAASSPRTRASSPASSSGSTAPAPSSSRQGRSSTSRPRSICGTRSWPAGCRGTSISIARERFVGDGMQDHLVVQRGAEPLAFEIGLEVGADFADIITVKEHDFALGHPATARPLPPAAAARSIRPRTSSCSRRPMTAAPRRRSSSRSPAWSPTPACASRLELRAARALGAAGRRRPSLSGEEQPRHAVEHRFGEEREHVRESLSAWHLRVPRLRTASDDLRHSFTQSVAELAALRLRRTAGSGCCRPPECPGS